MELSYFIPFLNKHRLRRPVRPKLGMESNQMESLSPLLTLKRLGWIEREG